MKHKNIIVSPNRTRLELELRHLASIKEDEMDENAKEERDDSAHATVLSFVRPSIFNIQLLCINIIISWR